MCYLVCTYLILPTGIFNQYDTMIYPPPESVLKHLKGMLSRQEIGKHPEIHCPSPEQMRKDCLVNYLAAYEPVLKSECIPNSASTLVSEVLHIYLQLAEHLLYTGFKVSMASPSFEIWPVANFMNVRINYKSSPHNSDKCFLLPNEAWWFVSGMMNGDMFQFSS